MLSSALSFLRGSPPPPLLDQEREDAFLRELMTAQMPRDTAPSYIVVQHQTYELPRPEFVGLTEEERRQFLRPEPEPPGRPLMKDLMRPAVRVFDFVIGDPLRMVFGNLGLLVTGAAVIGFVALVGNLLLSTLMAPFH